MFDSVFHQGLQGEEGQDQGLHRFVAEDAVTDPVPEPVFLNAEVVIDVVDLLPQVDWVKV